MDFLVWGGILLAVLMMVSFGIYRRNRRKLKTSPSTPSSPSSTASKDTAGVSVTSEAVEKNAFKISYVPSDMEWSGSSNGDLPLKTLTYKQYECLEDARYGFKIVGVTPSARKDAQPNKTRAHGQKTVASLVRHGFLMQTDANVHVITDLGLNALEVCSVRY